MDAATIDGQTRSDGSTGSPDRAATESTASDGLSAARAARTTDRAETVAAVVDEHESDDETVPPDSAPAAAEVTAGGRTAPDEHNASDDGRIPTDSL